MSPIVPSLPGAIRGSSRLLIGRALRVQPGGKRGACPRKDCADGEDLEALETPFLTLLGPYEVVANHLAQDGEQRYAVPTLLRRTARSVSRILERCGVFGGSSGMARPISFGSFTLNLERRQLLSGRDRQPAPLSPKAYELLRVLVETRPRAVAKSELHDRLWPSTFVSEATLASLVTDLREHWRSRPRDTLHSNGSWVRVRLLWTGGKRPNRISRPSRPGSL